MTGLWRIYSYPLDPFNPVSPVAIQGLDDIGNWFNYLLLCNPDGRDRAGATLQQGHDVL